jgi:hypothetical protein
MSQVQLEAFFLVQNACTAFPSTLVSMLELSPPLPILPLLRVAGLSGLNTIIVQTGEGVHGSVVGIGRKVAGSIPDEVDFFNLLNPSSRIMALGSTQPLIEMSTRKIPLGKVRPARKADNLTAIC